LGNNKLNQFTLITYQAYKQTKKGEIMEELQLINAALLKNEIIPDIMAYGKDIFQNEKHKKAYEIIVDLYDRNVKIDLPIFISEIKKLDLYNYIGGDKFAGDIASSLMVLDHMELITNMAYVNRKSIVRDLSIDYVKKKISLEDYTLKLQEIFESEISVEEGLTLGDYTRKNQLDDIFPKADIIETNIGIIDEKIGGFLVCDLNIIAARPGEGKTTFALQLCDTIDDNPLFFSLEMPKSQLLAKEINKKTGIPGLKIIKGNLSDYERGRVLKAIEEIEKESTFVIYEDDSLFEMIAKIKKGIRKHKSRTVVIDYLQLITGVKAETRNLVVAEVTRQLKKLAKKEKITIIALCQFSREVEKQKREPMLSDLRDSGSIEQDASLVIFIHEGQLIVAKVRMGQVGKIPDFYFDKPNSIFREGVCTQPFVQYTPNY
jgi:replicative DNA helicase